jgi:hypothetical protein
MKSQAVFRVKGLEFRAQENPGLQIGKTEKIHFGKIEIAIHYADNTLVKVSNVHLFLSMDSGATDLKVAVLR